MGTHLRRALPVFMLTAAIPLIPVLALFIVPHPPSPACAQPGCRTVASGANSSQIPASRLEFAEHSAFLLAASSAGTAVPGALPWRLYPPLSAKTQEGTR
jgi:hypothetical protein